MTDEEKAAQEAADKLKAPTLPADAVRSLEGLISRSGGSDATNVLLFNDNKELRDELRDLKTKVPKDGTVVFSKEEADALVAYRALGKPEDLSFAVTERDTLKADADKAARIAARNEAVKLAGFDPEKSEYSRSLTSMSISLKTAWVSRGAKWTGKSKSVPSMKLSPSGQAAWPTLLRRAIPRSRITRRSLNKALTEATRQAFTTGCGTK